jgi:hypothetical protein
MKLLDSCLNLKKRVLLAQFATVSEPNLES